MLLVEDWRRRIYRGESIYQVALDHCFSCDGFYEDYDSLYCLGLQQLHIVSLEGTIFNISGSTIVLMFEKEVYAGRFNNC